MIGNKKDRGKPIGERNGIKIYANTKKRKPINQISKKQSVKNKCWKKITDEKFESVGKICLWCGRRGSRKGENPINGHHIERRNGHNNTLKNCYPIHDFGCHTFVTDKNVDCNLFPSMVEWNLAHPENQFKLE